MLVPAPRRADGSHPSPMPIADIDVAGDLAARRRAALLAVRDEVQRRPADGTASDTGIALRRYGPGCLALALGGAFAAGDVARLRSLDLAFRRLATAELVMELSGLRACDRVLARCLARVRIGALVAGATVELHGPPTELGSVIGATADRESWR